MIARGHAVVVTGVGIVSALGIGRHETWDAALAGRSGAGPLTLFDPADHHSRIACEVPGFDPAAFLDRKLARRYDRSETLAVAAAKLAVEDARLVLPEKSPEVGVAVGCGSGGNATYENAHRTLLERGPERVSPLTVPIAIANMSAGAISIELGLQGPLQCHITACASGTHAIGEAAEIIRRGAADTMLAGGSEAAITPFVMAALDATRALSRHNDDPAGASRPFDRDRDGFVMGEGAAVLVLERADRAFARGAQVLCEVAGYGATCDAFHVTEPEPSGRAQADAIAAALRRAGREPAEVDYVNAHGTSTAAGDPVEVRVLRTALGETAASTAVSSTKSMHGHCMGATGAIEAALCAMAIETGTVPPTINLDHLDPECEGVDHVRSARSAPLRVALSNSFGFGGHNAVLALTAVDG
jgi:3-oxoacyl-[acyl-carrier-protein] synthase II